MALLIRLNLDVMNLTLNQKTGAKLKLSSLAKAAVKDDSSIVLDLFDPKVYLLPAKFRSRVKF